MKTKIKGSFVWMTAKRIIVTTNIHPSKWYGWDKRENQQEALKRRFVDYGYIMAWTSTGLGKVDPDDFWPLEKTSTTRHAYKALNAPLMTLNEAIMPTFQIYLEDMLHPSAKTPLYDAYLKNLPVNEDPLDFLQFCTTLL